MRTEFDISQRGRFYVMNWAGNRMFDSETYDSFESAIERVDVQVSEMLAAGTITESEFEDVHGEYYAVPVDQILERQRRAACQQLLLDRLGARHGYRSAQQERAWDRQRAANGHNTSLAWPRMPETPEDNSVIRRILTEAGLFTA